MRKNTDNLVSEVMELLKTENYTQAYELLSKLNKDSKDPKVLKARYLITSPKNSKYYNEELARSYLQLLTEQLHDTWGFTELGKCYLSGVLFEANSFLAEDMLNRSMHHDPEAKFLVAKIHADGLHKDGDESVKDIDEAINLYKELAESEKSGRFGNMAKYAYAEIIINKAEPTPDEKLRAFEYLLFLATHKNSNKSKVIFAEFFIQNLRSLLPSLFSWDTKNATEHETLELDSRRTACLSALDVLSKNIS
ncbi:MAG: hypothetical protein CMI54_00840 [Parcubacteria group bacterium]|nr:hypothetical protein [Parcubacteria group bacterium]